MTFKNSEEARQCAYKSLEARNANTDRIQVFINNCQNGFIDQYNEKVAKLARGEKLSMPEKEFMKHYETMFEYVRPKLARREEIHEIGGTMSAALTRLYDQNFGK